MFWGGPWKCQLTFWRYFEDPPHKNDTRGTFSEQFYISGGVPKKCKTHILVWSPHEKYSLQGVVKAGKNLYFPMSFQFSQIRWVARCLLLAFSWNDTRGWFHRVGVRQFALATMSFNPKCRELIWINGVSNEMLIPQGKWQLNGI